MRCFISINLGSELDSYLKSLLSEIKPDLANLSIAADSHITLKFLGEIGEDAVSEAKTLLRGVVFPKFKAKLASVGVFPNESYMRVIWVGAEPEEQFKALFEQIESKLKPLLSKHGIKNDFDFKAHITLARVKFVKDKEGFKRALKEIKVEKKEFDVNSFFLMKSALTPEGPVYEVVEEFKLK